MASNLDMAAASRVARRVNLSEIRLIHLKADRFDDTDGGELSPDLTHDHRALKCDGDTIVIASRFVLTVTSSDTKILTFSAGYQLTYELTGDEPVDQVDLGHFASANGAYHSWPFVRELLFGLTSRMGLPPFMLPVMAFIPKSAAKPAT